MKQLHIAVGVIEDAQGRLLISERKADCAYAGQWEFPGGKVEADETVVAALKRELHEELAIEVEQARPLIRVAHRYPDRHVLLDTWRVTRWSGTPRSREGQRFVWAVQAELAGYPMLAANRPIANALRLPACYLITPEPQNPRHFLKGFEASLRAGIHLARLRAPALTDSAYRQLAAQCCEIAAKAGACLLLDRLPREIEALDAGGLHLRAADMNRYDQRPVARYLWLAASCHNAAELTRAVALEADFAVLGPVQATPSHARIPPLGWTEFAALRNALPLPVYALGGMNRKDLETAWAHGGQGIAAIRGLWREDAAPVIP